MFASIAERRIREAIQEGLLDDLALKGKPIPHEDCAGVAEELRMGYKILKNAGYIPEELQLHQEILSLQDMLRLCTDPEQQQETRRKLTLRQLHFDMLIEKKGRNLAIREYQGRLQDRLLGKG